MIYIQSDNNLQIPHHFDASCALYGSIDLGIDYKLITYDDIIAGRFDKLIPNNLFVGSVEFMTEVFSRIGLSNIRIEQNSNRESQLMSLLEAKSLSKVKPIFIKPSQIKLFTGFVLDDWTYTSISNISDDTTVMVYEPFKSPIHSEWRVYIYRDNIEDIKNYSGYLDKYPNWSYINDLVEKNKLSKSFPSTYIIDIGILNNDENVVIEYNDMWSIGNYGIPNDTYVKMLMDRYFSIIKNKK